MSIYHDRHTILRSPKQPTLEEELAGQTPMSQIQRVMAELGIESIPAYSPQAKGRIERLWGTLQDRLTKELRLAGITTLEEANAFLPGFIDALQRPLRQGPPGPAAAPGCRCPRTWTSTTTSPSARPARCAPITASASSGQTPATAARPQGSQPGRQERHASTSCPKETSTCITANDPVALSAGLGPRSWRHARASLAEVAAAAAKPADPKAAARRRGWLFAQG